MGGALADGDHGDIDYTRNDCPDRTNKPQRPGVTEISTLGIKIFIGNIPQRWDFAPPGQQESLDVSVDIHLLALELPQ